MKTLYRCYWLVLLLALLPSLAACPVRTVHEKPPATAAEAVQHSIDEVNVAIAAASSTLLQAYKDGAVTWQEFTSTRDTLNEAATYRDQATALLGAGDPGTAQGRVKLASALLSVAQKRLAAIKKGT